MFTHLAEIRQVEIFATLMKDIEPALTLKRKINSATVVPIKNHNYLNVFSWHIASQLPLRCDMNLKIDLLLNIQALTSPLYGMS